MAKVSYSRSVPFLRSFIKREQAKGDALFLSIGEGAIVTDDQGRISRVNKAALDILGYSEEELLGSWYPGSVVDVDAQGKSLPNLERPLTRVFMTGKSVSDRAFYRGKNGNLIPVAVTASPVLSQGKPIGAIVLFRDISTDLTLEQAKDDFISISSHQLRTPATGVKQYVGMLLDGYAGKMTHEQKTLLTKAYESNERQLKIIDDLLKVARLDAGYITLNLESADLIQLLEDVIYEQLGKMEKRNQKISFIHRSRKLDVLIDPARMRMVFENLIDNACKYTSDNKRLRVEVSAVKKCVEVRIKDEGVGIANKDRVKLFQKFSRIDHQGVKVADGSGLGLYWAKQIVDLHHGNIKVSSVAGKGSVFTVSLPIQVKKIKKVAQLQPEQSKVILKHGGGNHG